MRTDTRVLSPIAEAPPACAACRDAHFVTLRRPVGHRDFGKAVACRACRPDPWHPSAVGFGARTPRRFGEYIDRIETGVFRRACDDLLRGDRWLVYMRADTGCGKTHLAEATVAEFLERRLGSAYFAEVPSMLNELRHTFERGESGSVWSRLEFFKSRDLLALDDLGSEKPTVWAAEQLFTVIDARTRAQKATIVTTNVLPGVPTERIEKRVNSRLKPGEVFVPSAPDLRGFYESQEAKPC